MQTSAVYAEPRIKIYGLNEALNLSMFEIKLDARRIASCGLCINGLEKSGAKFELTLIQCVDPQTLFFYILVKNIWAGKVRAHMEEHFLNDAKNSVRVISPVATLYFHGPHFGDRPGIADAAFAALKKKSVQILAAVCSGSTIYIAMPQNELEKARPIMNNVFETPTTKDHL